MDPQIQALLEKDNPWLRDPRRLVPWIAEQVPSVYLERKHVNVKRWEQKNKAHLVVGPRQAGKSTAIWQWLRAKKQSVLFIDCEQPLIRSWCASAPQVAADIRASFTDTPILFFEEVQHLGEAGLFLKGMADRKPGVPILVTGSSAYHLRSKTRESLAGRATRVRLLTFSWDEIRGASSALQPLGRRLKENELFQRHLVYGGYPEVWLSAEPETILTDLVESFVMPDASDLERLKRPDAFRLLISLSARQVGSLVNVSEWAQILNVSRETVYSYLEILQSSLLVQPVRPFVGGKRSELTKSPKVYWLDVGLRNRLLSDFRPLDQRLDRGPLLESWAFTELAKTLPSTSEIFFWRSTAGAEVDFVIRSGERLAALEVKATGTPKKKLTRAARSFIDAYRPGFFGVLQPGVQAQDMVGDTRIEWMSPFELSAWLRRSVGNG